VDAWWPAYVWWWASLPYHVGIENGETIKIVKRCIQLDNHITCHKLPKSSSWSSLLLMTSCTHSIDHSNQCYLHKDCHAHPMPQPYHMLWDKIKNIPYFQMSKHAQISWMYNIGWFLALFLKVPFFPFVIRRPSNIYIYIQFWDVAKLAIIIHMKI
jgi:hypothetical protein